MRPPFSPPHSCTVIIATLAVQERANSLRNAISSAKAGNHCEPKLLVVVNGNRFDTGLVSERKSRTDIELIQIPAASLSAAILAGRRAVTTEFFGFLDDDDEYLPGSIDERLTVLKTCPDACLVVTNGYKNLYGVEHRAVKHLSNIGSDPLAALFRENWLASCGAIFRTNDMPLELFEEIPRYREWTWLAFRVASTGKKIGILDKPTYRINDTIGSESKSDAYLLSEIDVYHRMLEQVTRREIANTIRVKLSHSWHHISSHYREKGSLWLAWAAHLRSLRYLSGWKFLTYTRRLLLPRPSGEAANRSSAPTKRIKS